MKIKLYLIPILLLALFSSVGAQQISEKPAWDVTIASGAKAKSNLAVVNHCQKAHTFRVTTENLFFLRFLDAMEVKVSGGQTVEMPVEFDTTGLSVGSYEGTVVINCLTCKNEGACEQDQERLFVKPRVVTSQSDTSQPAQTTQPSSTLQTPAQTPAHAPLTKNA